MCFALADSVIVFDVAHNLVLLGVVAQHRQNEACVDAHTGMVGFVRCGYRCVWIPKLLTAAIEVTLSPGLPM